MHRFLKKGLRHDIEDRKIQQRVFDRPTLSSLYELAKKNRIGELSGIVSTGKEANVFHGALGDKEIAVKIYCIDTSDFRNMGRYIRGDPRFRVGRDRRRVVYQWAHKEFKNLSIVCKKINCPEPVAVFNNVLVMGFIGKNGIPAPKLKDVIPKRPEEYFNSVIKDMRNMHGLGLVHGDISEYNILDRGKPVLIDFSLGTVLEHPLSQELLRRDVNNVVRYFNRFGLEKDPAEVLRQVAT